MKVRVCPKCGKHNLENAWSCTNCGESLSINTLIDAESSQLLSKTPEEKRVDNLLERIERFRSKAPKEKHADNLISTEIQSRDSTVPQSEKVQNRRKMGIFESLRDVSYRLGYDVRDLFIAGYSVEQINGVLTGKYTLQDLLKMEPQRPQREGGLDWLGSCLGTVINVLSNIFSVRSMKILLTVLFVLLLVLFCYSFYIETIK